MLAVLIVFSGLLLLSLVFWLVLLMKKGSQKDDSLSQLFHNFQLKSLEQTKGLEIEVLKGLREENERSVKNLNEFRAQLQLELTNSTEKLSRRMEEKLTQISEKVQENLNEGLKQTTKTFVGIMERLSKIDEAQKKIEQLSSNVVSLQDILSDKKSRGIFGEVQLEQILTSIFGEKNDRVFQLQYGLSNKTIVDAILFLPEPLGKLPIDSKFPLENYKRMVDKGLPSEERKQTTKEFKKNVKKHIDDIAQKYLIVGETSNQAVLFLPAEAIFAELHAYHAELVEYAHRQRVWMASPTTLMATLASIQVVLNNLERDKFTHIIHEELQKLSVEFNRYRDRWNKLSQHIDSVSKDVKDIHITTSKIGDRFDQINRSELHDQAYQLDKKQSEASQ